MRHPDRNPLTRQLPERTPEHGRAGMVGMLTRARLCPSPPYCRPVGPQTYPAGAESHTAIR